MHDRFPKDVDTQLSGLAWGQQDSNAVFSALKGEVPKMKRKVSLGLVLAIALVLLAAVALAIGLHFSSRYCAVQTARQAVMGQYGLSQEMLCLYTEEIKEGGGVTTAVYHSNSSEFLNAAAMGEYAAVVDARGKTTASRTHDGAATAAQSGDLAATVWGAAQLQTVLERYHAYLAWQAETPDISILPIARQVERLAALDKALAPIHVSIQRTELPDAADIPEEEALSLAKQSLLAHYGITADASWRIERHFGDYGGDAAIGRRYAFTFQKVGRIRRC